MPQGFSEARAALPDATILAELGFEYIGKYPFPTRHDWTIESLIGFVYSSSVMSHEVLGSLATSFEDDLRRELSAHEQAGLLPATIDFAYELARRPG